jgi:chromosomal replication initiation ATPase DnaA
MNNIENIIDFTHVAITAASDITGISVEAIVSGNKAQRIVRARNIAIYIACKTFPGTPIDQIAEVFGMKPNGVWYAIRKCKEIAEINGLFKHQLKLAHRKVQQNLKEVNDDDPE